jgi:structural maintenance of chromosome 4
VRKQVNQLCSLLLLSLSLFQTLSSLALVFALHVYKPTPLYFMDEIDAALDFRNVSIVANYIKDRTKNAQFIIISLRFVTFTLPLLDQALIIEQKRYVRTQPATHWHLQDVQPDSE